MKEELDLGLEEARLQTVDLEKELLVLRLAFGKLKAAASDAFAPITAGVVKALSSAVFWAIRLVKNIGYIISGVTGWQSAQDGLTRSVNKTYKALKREMADFDEINRLGTPQSQTVVTNVEISADTYEIPENLQGIINAIRSAIAPLQTIDLTNLQWQFARLKEAVAALLVPLQSGLKTAWKSVMVPFATWVVQQFVPTALSVLRSAVNLLTAALTPLRSGFSKVLSAMKPIFNFIGELFLTGLDQLRRTFSSLAKTIQSKSGTISAAFSNLKQVVSVIWKTIGPKLDTFRLNLVAAFGVLRKQINSVVSKMTDAFKGLTTFLLGAFTGNWKKAWSGLKTFLKNSINGILGIINGMLSGIAGGINAVIKLINSLKFTMPSWIPILGGKSFSLNLPTVKAPQIPYLAKGAVLPANKPFLAMVGDQKRGTNIEAPLATIQEAVAGVLGDMVPAMVAGFEALLKENVALRQTVQGISLGDETLARAVNRYNAKMEIVRGV